MPLVSSEESSFEYIRRYYGLEARRGMKVTAYGKKGVITGARCAYLLIKIEGEKRGMPYHPLDGIIYEK